MKRKYFIEKKYIKVAGFFFFVAAMFVVVPRIEFSQPDTEIVDRAAECEKLSRVPNTDRLKEEKKRCERVRGA